MRRICYFLLKLISTFGHVKFSHFQKRNRPHEDVFFYLIWKQWTGGIEKNDIVILWRMILWYCGEWYFWEWYCDIMENCNKFSRTRRCTMPGIFLSIEQRSFPKRIYNLDIATQRHRMSWKHRETTWYQGKSYEQGSTRRVGTVV